MKSHNSAGITSSVFVRVTCGGNGVSIGKEPSMDFPYRRLGLATFHSPLPVEPFRGRYFDPVVFEFGW
jgi:hypothetical protein